MEVVANTRVEYTLNATDGRPKHRYGRQVKVELLKCDGRWVLQVELKPRKVCVEVRTPAWLFANNVGAGKLTLKVGNATCPSLGVQRGVVQILLAEGLAEELAPLRDRLAQILSGGKLTSLRHPLKDCTNNLTVQQGSPGARLGLKRPQAFGASTAPAPKKGAAPQPLGSEQEAVLRYILEGKSVFLAGPAGTGKSLLLRRVMQELPSTSTFFTASTALAACQLGGTTINSFAGIGRGEGPFEAILRKANRPENRRKWRTCKVLIIDEISMVDGAMFDLLEHLAREVRGVNLPFGNIQLVLVGDFHQLPPVQKARKFCFESEAWKQCIHKCLELTQVHRQSDPLFVRWLGSIRKGKASREELDGLLDRCQRDLDDSDGIIATKLQTHRADCEEQNKAELDALPGESVIYTAQDDGLGTLMEQLSVSCPAKSRLELKVGAQVMLIQTISAAQQLVNGARGVVRGFRGAQRMPVVKFSNGVEMMIGREKWALSLGTAVATRKQVPLALAWSVSVHKSQGMTLDKVEVSLQKAFEYGMAYVALSRVRSLDGLKISGKIAPVSLQANPKVSHFYCTAMTDRHAD